MKKELISNMERHFDYSLEYINKIKNFEKKHPDIITNNNFRFLLHFYHSFNLLCKLIYKINFIPKDNFPKHRTVQIYLLKNNLSPLYSGFDRVINGFYEDGLILLRSCYESIIKIYFASYYPEDADSVLLKNPSEGKTRFNLSNFISHQLDVDWDFIYRILSRFSHGNTSDTLLELTNLSREGQKEQICFSLEYDFEKFSVSVNILDFIIWNYLKIFKELIFKSSKSNIEESLYDILLDTEKAFGEIIRCKPNNFKKTHNEVEKIFKLLKVKE